MGVLRNENVEGQDRVCCEDVYVVKGDSERRQVMMVISGAHQGCMYVPVGNG